jgi:hypothetical protein
LAQLRAWHERFLRAPKAEQNSDENESHPGLPYPNETQKCEKEYGNWLIGLC